MPFGVRIVKPMNPYQKEYIRLFLRTICKQGTEGRGLFLGTRCEIV